MAVGAEAIFGNSVITTKLDSAINWARESSMWPYVFGTACCAIEFMSVASSTYDISRFGAEVVRFDLGEDYSVETAMVFGEIYRHNGEWKFRAVGQGYSGGLAAMCHQYGINI